jgi:hypothetical protein
MLEKTLTGGRSIYMKAKVILIFVGLILISTGLAFSEETSADNMQLVVRKIRADKKLFVAANMRLTEKEAKGFWPIYGSYQNELFLLRARTLKLIDDYAQAYKNMTDGTAKKLLDESITIDSLGLKLRQVYLPKFREVLSNVKVVRYYQIENKIHAALFYELAAKIPLIQEAK